eukprot:gnl/Chilomastix_caulleri/7580.p1 GENE.gnl/Chilomastix_caulleri/7580~~gnl/Chilomastix_caulleri/7580.p1  ORF type:complete len:83 (-),score=8.54 gnl/Chilomastix_caulleri/7580:146-394(-)
MGMRHNYALSDKKRPKQHGMYKLTLDSPMRKLRRRQHRREKAAEVFPRPVNGPLPALESCVAQLRDIIFVHVSEEVSPGKNY